MGITIGQRVQVVDADKEERLDDGTVVGTMACGPSEETPLVRLDHAHMVGKQLRDYVCGTDPVLFIPKN